MRGERSRRWRVVWDGSSGRWTVDGRGWVTLRFGNEQLGRRASGWPAERWATGSDDSLWSLACAGSRAACTAYCWTTVYSNRPCV